MVRKCGVEGCLSDSNRPEDLGVTFHKVPMHSDIRPKWLSLCKIREEKKVCKVIYICSRHFLRADFCSFKGKKYMLRQGVLPSVFPWDKSKLEAIKAEIKRESTVLPKSLAETPLKCEQDSVIKDEKLDYSEESSQFDINDTNVGDIKSEDDATQASMIKEEPVPAELSNEKIDFHIDSEVEALGFNNTWYTAKIAEVDYEENEVLIHFENDSNKNDEWICMDSPRLRPIKDNLETSKEDLSEIAAEGSVNTAVKKRLLAKFIVGERCLASWSDARKFPATVTKVLGNHSYEVLFDDGFVKNLKAHRMLKTEGRHIQSSPLFDPIKSTKEERREKKRKLNVVALFRKRPRLSEGADKPKEIAPTKPEAKPHSRTPSQKAHPKKAHSRGQHKSLTKPQSKPAEANQEAQSVPVTENSVSVDSPTPRELERLNWIPQWVNGEPVGVESTIETHDGRRNSVIVPDPRLPEGWTKHLTRRPTGASAGKWDTVILSPDNRRFRSRGDMKAYLEANPQLNLSEYMFDFSLHRQRQKRFHPSEAEKPRVAPTIPKIPPTPENSSFQKDNTPEPIESETGGNTRGHLSPRDPSRLKNDHILGHRLKEDKDVPSLKILHVDDAYKCPIEGCGKNFRKENLAQMHVKHYHPKYTKFLDSTPNVADLAYARTVGDALDRSPGAVKTTPSRAIQPKPVTAKTVPKPSQTSLNETDVQPLSLPPQPVLPPKDSEIIKLLSSKPFEQQKEVEQDQPAAPSVATPPVPPTTVHADIKLKDLLIKSESVPKMDDKLLKNLSSTRPTGIKMLLPVRPPAETEQPPAVEVPKKPHSAKSGPKHGVKRKKISEILEPSVEKEPIEPIEAPPLEPPILYPEPPTHIIEGGKVIKIVRMKQEEIINCTCGYTEEDGLMIQCELCLCWQHAYCNNIEQESQVPEKYICYICQNPAKQRSSRKYYHDQDWLKQGVLPTASYHAKDEETLQKRFEKLKKAHDISGALVELNEFVHTLRVKLKIAEAKNHPKLYLWSKPWEKGQLPEKTESATGGKHVKTRPGDEYSVKIENEEADNNSQHSESQNESMLMMILKNDGKEDKDLDLNTIMDNSQAQAPIIPQPEAAIDSAVCRVNLLEHISHSQTLVEERLDDFEQKIAALEEGLPLDEDENYPKSRQMLQMLLRDVNTLKEFSTLSSI